LAPVLAARPKWVSREITKDEAEILALEIWRCSATSAIEIGVASGFSSAVVLACLRTASSDAQLYAYDLSPECYFDKDRVTGQAVAEIFGSEDNYNLITGVTSADIKSVPEQVRFIFIDASHRHPWPSLDLLSLYRFLQPGGVIGLHDINLPLQSRNAYRQNGPRDLIRAWIGEKRIYKKGVNIGFVDSTSKAEVFESICRALQVDWDRAIDDKLLSKYLPLAEHFGLGARERLSVIFEEKKASFNRTKLLRL
jgi:predicted O-methyltransferase YrrM